MIITRQAIDSANFDIMNTNSCDPNMNLSDNELPVWRPYQYRHEHKFDELTRDTFECSQCGYVIHIQTQSPEPGEE